MKKRRSVCMTHTLLPEVNIWALGHGGGYERFLSLIYKICKKNKEDWTSVDKRLNVL